MSQNMKLAPEELEPPPYETLASTETPSSTGIEEEIWELACSIDVKDKEQLQLNAEGKPVWISADTTLLKYQRDGFIITSMPDASQIKVTNSERDWLCEEESQAGRLLWPEQKNVSLRSSGRHLVVFRKTIALKNTSQLQPIHQPEDQNNEKDCVKVALETSIGCVWVIFGTSIYEAKGEGDDLVIKSSSNFWLWDMSKKKFRWQKYEPGNGSILGFSKAYIIIEVGWPRLHEPSSGRIHADYYYPPCILETFTDFGNESHYGPVVSTRGVFLYMRSKNALIFSQIIDPKEKKYKKYKKKDDKGPTVHFQLWESSSDIQGCSLVLRGDLDNLKVEFLKKRPSWKRQGPAESPIITNSFMKKYIY